MLTNLSYPNIFITLFKLQLKKAILTSPLAFIKFLNSKQVKFIFLFKVPKGCQAIHFLLAYFFSSFFNLSTILSATEEYLFLLTIFPNLDFVHFFLFKQTIHAVLFAYSLTLESFFLVLQNNIFPSGQVYVSSFSLYLNLSKK